MNNSHDTINKNIYAPLYDSDGQPLRNDNTTPHNFDNVTRRKNHVPKNQTPLEPASESDSKANSISDNDSNQENPTFYVKIRYEICHKKEILKSKEIIIPSTDPNTEIPNPRRIFENILHGPYLDNNIDHWTLTTPSDLIDLNMGDVPIEVIVGMIQEYDGEEKDFNIYINKIDRLWKHVENNCAADKNRFMFTLQISLNDRAAHATNDADFHEWPTVRQALKENINPQKNIEKAELKLLAAEQYPREDVETFAHRISELLDNLNKSFCLEVENDILKRENDRKARKAFENGLLNTELKNRAITRGNKTFRESVDYVIEQELRQIETKPKNPPERICSFCLAPNHEAFECRKRRNQQTSMNLRNPQMNQNFRNQPISNNFRRSIPSDLPNREVTCYHCNQRGHYASQCQARNNPNIPNNRESFPNNSNSAPNSPRRSYNVPNSPTNNPRNSIYNQQNTNNFNAKPRESQSPRDVRVYQNEIPLEEIIVMAEEIERKN